MRTINHESDFKIREQREDGTPIWNAPFRFTYYVKMSRGTFVASYDGREFINCHKGTGEDEGKLIVAFDSPQFGTGVLRVKREFFLNDTDFADGVRHYVSDESTDVILDRGATSEGIVVDAVFNPSYYKGDRGMSAYEVWLSEGNKGSVEDYFAYIKGDKGDTGVGIKDVKQTVSSAEDEGRNTIRVTMTNGDYYEFYIRNGSKGEKGDKGDTFTYDNLTEEEKEDLASRVDVPEIDTDRLVTTDTNQEIGGNKNFTHDIHINSKSVIRTTIDGGELKVTHKDSNKGFIIRTNWDNQKGILPAEMLTTDGYNSYSYKFPEKSGTVALIDDIQNSGTSLIEVADNPKESPTDNTIAINTSNGKVFFGIANKGWWFVTAKMLGGAEIDGETLKISAEYDNGTISVSGEIKDGLLIL